MAEKTGNEEEMQGELSLEDTTPDYEQLIKDYEQQIKDFEKQLKDANKALKDIEKNRSKQSEQVWSIPDRAYIPNPNRKSDEDYENAKNKVAEIQNAIDTAKANKKKAVDERVAQENAKWEEALKQRGWDGSNRTFGLGGKITRIFQESPEDKEEREKGLKERQEAQKEDIKDFKSETEEVVEDSREESESDAEKNIASLENILKERLEGSKNDPIYNELPKTIRQAYKAKEFGDPMDEDIRKAYREVMRKPKKDRDEKDKETIDAYKKELERTKDARQARDWYTMNAIGTALLNVGTALKGGTPTADTAWNKRQGARIEAAQQRYKDLLDTKANTVIEEVKNKQGYDQATQKAIRSLYNDKRLQPVLNRLDTDSQIQLIDLMQKKSGAINFNAFVNALVLSLMDNPQGAVTSALGLGKDFVDLLK